MGGMRLKFKGDAKVKKRKRKRVDHQAGAEERIDMRHERWWAVDALEQIKGRVLFEAVDGTYLKIEPSGTATTGEIYDENAHKEAEIRAIKEAVDRQERGEEPAPAAAENQVPSPFECVVAVPAGEGKYTFKSWLGKYMTVDEQGMVVFEREAATRLEMWLVEPYESDKGGVPLFTIRACTGRLLTLGPNKDVRATSQDDPTDAELIKIRSCGELEDRKKQKKGKDDDEPMPTDWAQFEENEVRRYQSFKDSKVKVSGEDLRLLKRAKKDGNMRGVLLDRRSKLKADRYCK